MFPKKNLFFSIFLDWACSYAGRKIEFALGQRSRFSKLFLGILLSEFRLTVFIPGAVEWNHKSATPIFSQPIFFTNIWMALFEKETWMEKLPRLRNSKMPRIWRKNPLKWVVSISRDYWIYSDIIWQSSSGLEFWGEFGESRDFFFEQVSSFVRHHGLNLISQKKCGLNVFFWLNPPPKNSVWTLADCEWRAAAPGPKLATRPVIWPLPFLLPRAYSPWYTPAVANAISIAMSIAISIAISRVLFHPLSLSRSRVCERAQALHYFLSLPRLQPGACAIFPSN